MIVLHGQPKSTNHIYKSTARGGFASVYMSAEGKALKEDYQWQAKTQWKKPIITGEISITVRVYHGDKRKRDEDNYHKLWQDALSGIVYVDDSQISEKHSYRLLDKMTPRIEIEIKEI